MVNVSILDSSMKQVPLVQEKKKITIESKNVSISPITNNIYDPSASYGLTPTINS